MNLENQKSGKVVKRKHNSSISVFQKLEALKRIDNGEAAKKIAAEIGVGTSTISDWKKNRSKIESFSISTPENVLKSRKRLTTAQFSNVQEAVHI